MSDPVALYPVDEAIWRGDVPQLLAHPQVDPSSWPGSVQLDCRLHGPDVPLLYPTARGPAAAQIAVVMMVKDEADVIGYNLAWQHYLGIRKAVVLDNGSTDGTADILRRFREERRDFELIIVDDTRIAYSQGLKTSGLMRLAVSIWPDLAWTFAIDADEFLIPSRGFDELLGLSSIYDGITLPKVTHHLARGEAEPSEACPLAAMPYRSRPFLVPPKVACRSDVSRGVTDGNHRLVRIDDTAPRYRGGLSIGLYMREFPHRSYAQLCRKTMNGGPAVLAGRAEGTFSGGEHWVRMYQVLKENGPEGLRSHFEQDWCVQAGPGFVYDPFPGVPA